MKEERLVIRRSGTEGAAVEEFWFINSETICWLKRGELVEQPERCLAALTRKGFKITLERIQDELAVKAHV